MVQFEAVCHYLHTHSKVYIVMHIASGCAPLKSQAVLPLLDSSSMVNTTRHILNIYRIREKRWQAVHKGWLKKNPTIRKLCLLQAISNSVQNYCNSNSNSGQKSYWILQYAIIYPQKFYCNNAINAIMQYFFNNMISNK